MILLRSSWQTVNIGDIAHTPGALRLLQTHLPDARLALWPVDVDDSVAGMLQQAFPTVPIVRGKLDARGEPDTPELREAFAQASLLLHGSGPSVVARRDLEAWRESTDKPYGIFGVTVSEVGDGLRDLLSGAAFLFCRDTVSLDLLHREQVACPVMEFGPDATFAMHLRDEPRALAYMQQAGLEPGGFICAIPRLRYTPYHQFKPMNWSEERIRQVESVNAEMQEPDHAKLREAMTAWVRETGLTVLACPEMIHEVALAKELLVNPLPEDVKRRVAWRDSFWRPDEAASVYARAAAVVSFELHSCIIAAAVGTPALHLRQPTDTCKGQMWRDVGLENWLFEIDSTVGLDISRTLLGIHHDPDAARGKLQAAMAFVGERCRRMAEVAASASGRP